MSDSDPCPECGYELYDEEYGCPRCRHGRAEPRTNVVLVTVGFGCASLLVGGLCLFRIGAVLANGPVMNFAILFVGAVFQSIGLGSFLRPRSVRAGFGSGTLTSARPGSGRQATRGEARGYAIVMGLVGTAAWLLGVFAGNAE